MSTPMCERASQEIREALAEIPQSEYPQWVAAYRSILADPEADADTRRTAAFLLALFATESRDFPLLVPRDEAS
jgi:hypothetical protein